MENIDWLDVLKVVSCAVWAILAIWNMFLLNSIGKLQKRVRAQLKEVEDLHAQLRSTIASQAAPKLNTSTSFIKTSGTSPTWFN